MIRILIASISTAFRAGIRSLLDGDSDFEISDEMRGIEGTNSALPCADMIWVAPAADLHWILTGFRECFWGAKGFLLVGDEDLPGDGIDWRAIRQHGWGILPEYASALQLKNALHAIDSGLVVLSPAGSVLDLALNPQDEETMRHDQKEASQDDVPLTEREMEVLALLGQGMANKQIAKNLRLSENTIKFHISSIYSKLNVNNRTEALRKGARLGLVAL